MTEYTSGRRVYSFCLQDIQLLISSLKKLKLVQSKLVQSKEAVDQLGVSKEGNGY